MSAFVVKFICSTILSVMGLFVVKNISGSEERIVSIKNLFLIALLIILPIIIRDVKYNYLYTIIIYGMTFLISKYFLNISFTRSAIASGIMILSLFLLDFVASIVFASIMTLDKARNTWYISVLSNLIFAIVLIIFFHIKKVKLKIVPFVDKLENKKSTKIIIAITLTIIAMSTILYVLSNNFSINKVFTTNFLIFIIFFLLIIMLLGERNSYDKLSDEYDSLFNYVKVFEDWIEKEQLNRHEYKNQLAVLRAMTKEKKVRDKIDKIVSENISIDNKMINQLKNLPSGGFKGLLYYKIALARKLKVHLDVDVSDDVGRLLNKLNANQLEVLSKLIGIYIDNAIEAASETKKKLVAIEIYSLNKSVNIVVTNTFNTDNNIADRYEKGISTKGEGRGNGLYFAKKLISINSWIDESQEIMENFYIQRLILNSNSKKQIQK